MYVNGEPGFEHAEEINIGSLENFPPYVPLGEAVFKTLKTAILDGALKPGQPIVESKIADNLGISRTPVREAMRMLAAEDLVTFLPGRKVIVSIPSKRDVEEVYEIRWIVETEALRRITPDQEDLIRELEECVEEAERLRKEGNIREMAKANSHFHLTIISVLGNRRLQRFIDSLNDTISQYRSYSLTPEWALESEKEHKQIVSNLKSGDVEKAVSLLHHNLTRPKQMLSTLFSAESDLQGIE